MPIFFHNLILSIGGTPPRPVLHRHFHETERGAGVAKVVDLRNTTTAGLRLRCKVRVVSTVTLFVFYFSRSNASLLDALLTFHIRDVRKRLHKVKRVCEQRDLVTARSPRSQAVKIF
jgi:hypothetical protein